MDKETILKIINMLDKQITQHNEAQLLCKDEDFEAISSCKWALSFLDLSFLKTN
jgi:hypothetical protein